MNAATITEEQVKRDVLLAAQPTKEFVTVEEVADLAVYLCSDAAKAITGIFARMLRKRLPVPMSLSTVAGRQHEFHLRLRRVGLPRWYRLPAVEPVPGKIILIGFSRRSNN